MLRLPVGIGRIQLEWKPLVFSLSHDAKKRRDPDSTGQENCRLGRIRVLSEGLCCPINPHTVPTGIFF